MDNSFHSNAQAKLNVCGCGSLHFTDGPMTLHLEPEEFTRFAGEVGRLATHFQHVIAGREPVPTPKQKSTACHEPRRVHED